MSQSSVMKLHAALIKALGSPVAKDDTRIPDRSVRCWAARNPLVRSGGSRRMVLMDRFEQ